LLGGNGCSGLHILLLLPVITLNGLLLQKAEDIIEDEVAVGLLGEEKGLDKFAPGLVAVGHLTDDLDDDPAICRRLSIDRVDEDLAILEANRGNFLVDFLRKMSEQQFQIGSMVTRQPSIRPQNRGNCLHDTSCAPFEGCWPNDGAESGG
jgi:hypothetical protein